MVDVSPGESSRILRCNVDTPALVRMPGGIAVRYLVLLSVWLYFVGSLVGTDVPEPREPPATTGRRRFQPESLAIDHPFPGHTTVHPLVVDRFALRHGE